MQPRIKSSTRLSQCAIEPSARKYGVRRQAKRDAALDGVPAAEIRREIEEKRRRASLALILTGKNCD